MSRRLILLAVVSGDVGASWQTVGAEGRVVMVDDTIEGPTNILERNRRTLAPSDMEVISSARSLLLRLQSMERREPLVSAIVDHATSASGSPFAETVIKAWAADALSVDELQRYRRRESGFNNLMGWAQIALVRLQELGEGDIEYLDEGRSLLRWMADFRLNDANRNSTARTCGD